MMIDPAYKVDVKLSIELLYQLITHADAETWLILRGDLSQFRDPGLQGLVRETDPNDNSLFAVEGRIAVPLTPENVVWLRTAVLPHVGIRTRICDVYLERNGRCLFAGCNRFRNGALFSSWVTDDFLQALQHDGIIYVSQGLTIRH